MPMPKPMEEQPKLLRACLYGDFGQGKTTLAGKLVEVLGGKTLHLTTDSAWTVLLGNPALQGKLDRVQYKSYGTGTTFGHLQDIALAYGDAEFYQNLIWDTTGQSIEIAVRHWTKVKKFSDQRDPEVASWTHYGLVRNKLADALTILKATQLNIIYIFHERSPSEEEIKKGKIMVRPSSPEKAYMEVAQECNLVARCFKERRGEEYLVQTEGTTTEAGKSQIPTIPQTTFKPDDLPKLLKQWRDS
jgi:hypothetical protein